MEEIQKLFHTVFESAGGIEDRWPQNFLQLKENANYVVSYIRKNYSNVHSKLPEIHVDFIKNDVLNACASKYKDYYFIGVYSGTYHLVADMFCKMFSTKSVLPHLGLSSLESDEKKTISAILVDGVIGVDYNLENVVYPKDELRLFYAHAYIRFVMDFLILHEIGHIHRGHNGYISSKLPSRFIWDELDYHSTRGSFLSPLDSQTLEMDADSFATNHGFIQGEFYIKNPESLNKKNHLMKNLYTSYENYYSHWSFAIYSFFRLTGFNEINLEKQKLKSHPPPSIRMAMILSNIISIIIKRNVCDSNKLSEYLVRTCVLAERAFSEITFQENKGTLFKNAFLDHEDYMDEIARNWNNVRPLLEPFAFGQLPPLSSL